MQQVGTSYNSSLLFVHSMHSNLLCFTIIVIVKVMSQSSHLPWGFVKVILWGGHYSLQSILGLYILQLIISPFVYFHPLQTTFTSQVPLQLYHLPMNTFRPDFMQQVFPSNLKNSLHGHHPLAYHQTSTPHPSLPPHSKELKSWGFCWAP